MKPSYYNVLTDLPDGRSGALLYNTRSRAIAVLSPEEKAAYETIAASSPVGDEFDELIAELRNQRFVLDDPETEANFMKCQFERYRYDDAVFELYVAPTMNCNFNCPYCFEHDKRPGRMSPEVQDRLCAFIEEEYRKRPYRELKIVWYGGEPLMEIDVIESLSQRFMAFCESKDIAYVASAISNTSLADSEVQDKLIACNVWSVMTTVDGVEQLHEARRVNRSGEPTYRTIMENVEEMTAKGICVDFRCILEKGNVDSCLEITKGMAHHENLGIRVKPMRDAGTLDREVEGAAAVEPLSPEEYADAFHRVFLQSEPGKKDYERALAPLHLHCSAAMDRGYAIDELGNVYNCGCAIGDINKKLFSIMEPAESRTVNWDMISWYGSHNPLDKKECRTCRVLPLCQGGCLRIDEEPWSECNPMRYIIEDMVKGYYQTLALSAD